MIRRPPRSTLFPTRRSSDLPWQNRLLVICLGVLTIVLLYRQIRAIGKLMLLLWAGMLLTVGAIIVSRSEEHTSELQSQSNLVCRLLLEKKNTTQTTTQSRLL